MRSSGPRVVTSGEWRIGSAGGAFGTFTLNGANFALTGTYDSGDAEPVTGCGGGCRTPVTLGLHTAFFNDIPGTIKTFAPGTAVIDGHAYTPFVEYTGSLILDGGVVTIAAPMSTDYPVLVSASTPFTDVRCARRVQRVVRHDPQLQFGDRPHRKGHRNAGDARRPRTRRNGYRDVLQAALRVRAG